MNLILDFVFVAGLVLIILIILLLWTKRKNGLHIGILTLIFVMLGVTMLGFYSYLHKIRWLFLSTFVIEDTSAVLIGPLIYLYLQSIFFSSKRMLAKSWIHFLFPLIYAMGISTPLMLSMRQRAYIFDWLAPLEDFVSLVIIWSLIYFYFSLKLIRRVEPLTRQYYANDSTTDMNWMRRFVIGAMLVVMVDVSTTIYELLFGELEWNVFFLTALALILLIGYLAFHGFWQSKMLIPDFLTLPPPSHESTSQENQIAAPASTLPEWETKSLSDKLQVVMTNEQPHLSEEVSLRTLAEKLETTDKKLSMLLNQHLNTNFYDFINTQRVATVIEKMQSPAYDHLTLLAIGFESGFKSKTSFNRVFKNITGHSPSEYKKQLKSDEE